MVSNYPTTYTLTLTNLNPIPAYSYLAIYLPPQITTIGQFICQSGVFSISCTYDTPTSMLTLSSFTSALAAGELASSPFYLQNLVNPSSTLQTSSFQIYYKNSNNQIIEYIAAGLPIQMTIAASFGALTITPDNSINSAPTALTVSFNVPSTTYQNNTLLVVTLPSVIALSSIVCTAISSNILAITSCSIFSNTIKIYISYASLSTSSPTTVKLASYNNYPSLQPYSIQVDLYGDIFAQSKLCSNANSPSIHANSQQGKIGISSYAFTATTLQTLSNLAINIANTSGSSFSYFTIKFPPDFGLSSSSCSVPAGISCSLSITEGMFNLTSSTSFSLPFALTITNILTPGFNPSTYIYLQTFTSNMYQMD